MSDKRFSTLQAAEEYLQQVQVRDLTNSNSDEDVMESQSTELPKKQYQATLKRSLNNSVVLDRTPAVEFDEDDDDDDLTLSQVSCLTSFNAV